MSLDIIGFEWCCGKAEMLSLEIFCNYSWIASNEKFTKIW